MEFNLMLYDVRTMKIMTGLNGTKIWDISKFYVNYVTLQRVKKLPKLHN